MEFITLEELKAKIKKSKDNDNIELDTESLGFIESWESKDPKNLMKRYLELLQIDSEEMQHGLNGYIYHVETIIEDMQNDTWKVDKVLLKMILKKTLIY